MTAFDTDHWLRHALEAARPWRGRVAPNPAVGAAVVRDDKLLATGAHAGPGKPHAEPDALDRAGLAQGATLYVTLEPCNHHGRTPPCTDRILAAGIRRVVFAHRDPNPAVQGGGAQRLRAAGVAVEERPLAEIEAFYRSFDRACRERLPTVTAKIAVDRAGRYAGPPPERYRITGDAAEILTHRFRARHDAILTTARTVNADDPRLDVRLPGESSRAVPVYVWDPRGELLPKRRLFATARSVTVLRGEMGAEPLRQAMTRVLADGHHHLWVEAGGRFVRALAETSYLHRLVLYLGTRTPEVSDGPVFALPETLPESIGARLTECDQFHAGRDTAYAYWSPGEEPPRNDLGALA